MFCWSGYNEIYQIKNHAQRMPFQLQCKSISLAKTLYFGSFLHTEIQLCQLRWSKNLKVTMKMPLWYFPEFWGERVPPSWTEKLTAQNGNKNWVKRRLQTEGQISFGPQAKVSEQHQWGKLQDKKQQQWRALNVVFIWETKHTDVYVSI